MRVYANAYELISEIHREVYEMGHIVHPHSMQNKLVKGDSDYSTKEIINYSYCLISLDKKEYLFINDERSLEWANKEFQERISENYKNPGKAWEIRRNIWAEFLVDGEFEYSYNERIAKSIKQVIRELKRNIETRQAIISIWDPNKDPNGLGGYFRVPCSIYYQLLFRSNQLHIVYNQRSADVVTHFGNDVYLAWLLMEYIAEEVGVQPGFLYHNIGSLHSYKKDWLRLKTTIDELLKSRL